MIERLEKNTTGADKENSGARLFAKIDQEERLQAALKDSEGEARALRKHLLTLMHHVHTSLGQADLGEGFAVNALPQVCPGLLIGFQHYLPCLCRLSEEALLRCDASCLCGRCLT